MLIHPRSVAHKVFDIWRSPGRFTKNSEIVVLPTGRYLLIYSDTDAHWSLKNQVLTLLASDDGGKTWFKHRELDFADLSKGEERLVTPRMSLLNDGRTLVAGGVRRTAGAAAVGVAVFAAYGRRGRGAGHVRCARRDRCDRCDRATTRRTRRHRALNRLCRRQTMR